MTFEVKEEEVKFTNESHFKKDKIMSQTINSNSAFKNKINKNDTGKEFYQRDNLVMDNFSMSTNASNS